jgi:hypothetical protein
MVLSYTDLTGCYPSDLHEDFPEVYNVLFGQKPFGKCIKCILNIQYVIILD